MILNAFSTQVKTVLNCSPEVGHDSLLHLDFMQLSLQVHDGFVGTDWLLFRLIMRLCL